MCVVCSHFDLVKQCNIQYFNIITIHSNKDILKVYTNDIYYIYIPDQRNMYLYWYSYMLGCIKVNLFISFVGNDTFRSSLKNVRSSLKIVR